MTTLTYETFGEVLPTPKARVAWLHEYHSRDVAAAIARTARGRLSPDDVQDTCQETFVAFWVWVGNHPLPPEAYMPVLQVIAKHKTFDVLRRSHNLPWTNALAALGEPDDGCPDGERYTAIIHHMGPVERQEFQAVLARLIDELPTRERLAATLYINHHGGYGRRELFPALAAMLSLLTGHPELPGTFKSLWHAARARLRHGLERLGYAAHG